jgi:4'-phosphopantetheinyl transferase
LRLLVGGVLGIAPESLRFAYGPHGKPTLAGPQASSVHFSLSRADDLALIAIAPGTPLGVDVEALREQPGLLDVADRYFDLGEAAALAGMTQADRMRAFYRYWTCKEAVAKARGEGLSIGLDRIQLECQAGTPARLIAVAGSTVEAAAWSLMEVRPAPGFLAAIASRARTQPPCPVTLDVARAVCRAAHGRVISETARVRHRARGSPPSAGARTLGTAPRAPRAGTAPSNPS